MLSTGPTSSIFYILEGTACYVGQFVANAEGFGLNKIVVGLWAQKNALIVIVLALFLTFEYTFPFVLLFREISL